MLQEVANHVAAIAGDNHEFGDTGSSHRLNGTLQKGALTHLQQTLGLRICQRAEALGHARR